METGAVDVLGQRRQLDKAAETEDNDRVIDILENLSTTAMTVELLAESKVGASVSKLRKHQDDRVSSLAKRLVKKWKALAAAAGVHGGGGSKGSSRDGGASSDGGCGASSNSGKGAVKPSSSSSGKGRMAAPMPPARPTISRGDSDVSAVSAESKSSGGAAGASTGDAASSRATTALAESGLPPARLKIRQRFLDALLVGFQSGNDIVVAALAKAIETEVDRLNPYTHRRDDYAAKVRELTFNLKKNDELREELREGEVSAERLCVMTSKELLPREKKAEIEKVSHDRAESLRLDWTEKNQEMINKQCGIKGTEGMFECGRCKSKKTTYFQKQTRSADEPMTTFVTCKNCGKNWKFC